MNKPPARAVIFDGPVYTVNGRDTRHLRRPRRVMKKNMREPLCGSIYFYY